MLPTVVALALLQAAHSSSRDEGFHGISYSRRQHLLGEQVRQKCQDIHEKGKGYEEMVSKTICS